MKYIVYLIFCISVISIRVQGMLPPDVIEACDAIYDPEVLTTSCCRQIDQFAGRIKCCIKPGYEGEGTLSSCSEVQCIADIYDVTSCGELDKSKLVQLIRELDKIDNETAVMNALVTKNCLRRNYENFPSGDPECSLWSYLNCVFFSYNIACPKTRSLGKCRKIKENIDICRPHADEYVARLGKSCSLYDM